MKILPVYILNFFKKFVLLVAAFSLARVLFYYFNKIQFQQANFYDFLVGFWFDCITAAILFIPLLAIEIFPQFWRKERWHRRLLKTVFMLIFSLSLLINFADIEYFKFTSTRSNFSTFKMLSYGSDFANQIPSFIKDYWYLLLIMLGLIMLANWTYNKWIRTVKTETKLKKQLFFFFTLIIISLSIGRGWGLRPISPIHAAQYTLDQNVPLVLNSAFTIIKSYGKKPLTEKKYFENQSIKNWFNPIKQYGNKPKLNNPNVVIILLESFSVEYIGALNNDSVTYTPFLDSLISKGLVFKNCFANGKKSIDAVPSVISSLPKLMEEEFITSIYATNQLESLPELLKKRGYTSSFYHGATNGSMNFDGFASKVKFDNYYGRKEYGNDNDFDGTWGIYDHLFLPWTSISISKMKEPFLGTIFSLSSHPPYNIPEELRNRFSGSKTLMHDAVRYADYSLSLFFKNAKQYDWYENTLFVITADHTSSSSNPKYFNDRGVMSIPLVFFHPKNDFFRGVSSKIVGQFDIMPTILDLIGCHNPFYSFGESIFSDKDGFSVTQLGNKYLVFGMDHFLVFQNGKIKKLYEISDKMLKTNLLHKKPELAKVLKNKLLAFIQTYHNGMIENNLKAK